MRLRPMSIVVLLLSLLLGAACSSPTPEPTSAPPTRAAESQPTVVSAPISMPKVEPTSTKPAATPLPAGPSPTRPAATAAPTATSGGVARPTATPPVAALPTAAPPPAPTKAAGEVIPRAGDVPRMKSPEAGVQLFLWGIPDIGRDLDLARNAGFKWIKQMFQWDHIERDGKGQFLWGEPDRLVRAANNYGLKIVARIDFSPRWAVPRQATGHNIPPQNYADFGDFVYELVNRYKAGSPHGQIHAYEIWNEPNLAREWGDRPPNAGEYVQLLKTAYLAAKRADRNAVVVTAGLSPTGTLSPEARPDDLYLEEMYRAGAKDYFDVLGVHAAGFRAPPEMSPDEIAANKEYGGQRFFGFRRVEDLRQIMVRNGDEGKQVMVLEMGWSTDNRPGSPYAWHAVSEKEKGEYIVRAYQFAQKSWSPWMGMMSTIYVSAPHWTPNDEQYYWSITEPNGSPRPSYSYIVGKLP